MLARLYLLSLNIFLQLFNKIYSISPELHYNLKNYKRLYNNLIPSDYVTNHPPFFDEKPVQVFLGFDIFYINRVNVIEQYFDASLFICMKWKDHRLNISAEAKNNSIVLSESQASRIWVPKLIFKNCKQCDQIKFSVDDHNLVLYPTNDLEFSSRFVGSFECKFNLRAYPFDTQFCDIAVQTFFYTNERLVLKRTGSFYFNEDNGLPEFETIKIGNKRCPATTTMSKKAYDCVEAEFKFERRVIYAVVQIYLPSFLIVAISWISFWLDADALAPRVALSLTSMLTLVTQFTNIQRSLPPVSYVKVIDIWMLACIFAVFLSSLELAFAHNIRVINKRVANDDSTEKIQENTFNTKNKKIYQINRSAKNEQKKNVNINKVDKISRFLFPLLFGIFNICYWIFVIQIRKQV